MAYLPRPSMTSNPKIAQLQQGFPLDMPTIGDGSPSPMKDIGHNEDIPVVVASTPTPEKPQLVRECPAPVYMATVSKGAAAILTFPRKNHAWLGYDRSTRCTQKAAKGCKKTQVRVYTQVQQGSKIPETMEYAGMLTQCSGKTFRSIASCQILCDRNPPP